MEQFPLAEAIGPGRGADGIGGFLGEQGLIAADQVAGGEVAPQVLAELFRAQPHRRDP